VSRGAPSAQASWSHEATAPPAPASPEAPAEPAEPPAPEAPPAPGSHLQTSTFEAPLTQALSHDVLQQNESEAHTIEVHSLHESSSGPPFTQAS
jgi:hypothetical protein